MLGNISSLEGMPLTFLVLCDSKIEGASPHQHSLDTTDHAGRPF